MKKVFPVLLGILAIMLTACRGSIAASQPSPAATAHATPRPVRPTPTPTRQGSYPVCNAKTTNTPCVQFASIQDAAVGESEVGAIVQTGISHGVVKVIDDITNVASSPLGAATTLNQIQFQCFNVQQAVWYGLYSTINSDASQTFRKSPFAEVDVNFIDHHKTPAAFASCDLTSAGVDRIDKAGMWDDGDFVGAWSLYDRTSFD